jgi:hypothetical protein
MAVHAWVLIFSWSLNGGWSVIDNIGSQASCEALRAEISAPKAKCIQYEIATPVSPSR